MAALVEGEIRYCPRCGAKLAQAEKFGRLRPMCPRCHWVYFADPKVAVAALIEDDGQVLLVRRVNEPMRGLWTLPAGFVDAGENPKDALARECLEETGLQVEVGDLLDVIAGREHARGAHILIVYRATILAGEMVARDDADAVAFFNRKALPELAFEATKQVLRDTLTDSE